MKVKIIKRKANKSGMCSIYLEIYKGYTKDANGKIKHNREYIPTKIKVYKSPKTTNEKKHNKEMMSIVDAIKSKQVLEIKNNLHGFKTKSKTKTYFFRYFENLIETRKDSKGNHGNWSSALKHLRIYCKNDSITFEQIDIEFIQGFKDYLKKDAKTKSGKVLSINTSASYFNKLRACLNQAFEQNIIDKNPVKGIKAIKAENPPREYLTLDEIDKLSRVECRYQVLKNAFLFSCFSGIRWSDIQKLTWGDIREEEDNFKIVFQQKKTKKREYLPINKNAIKLLGERKESTEKVFVGLKYSAHHNIALARWILKAGITKKITFHCARHSFAVMLLERDVPIYTLSKLLGHSELKTTEIYAKIVDKLKINAVNKIPDINL